VTGWGEGRLGLVASTWAKSQLCCRSTLSWGTGSTGKLKTCRHGRVSMICAVVSTRVT
jgi:hypothetical protein